MGIWSSAFSPNFKGIILIKLCSYLIFTLFFHTPVVLWTFFFFYLVFGEIMFCHLFISFILFRFPFLSSLFSSDLYSLSLSFFLLSITFKLFCCLFLSSSLYGFPFLPSLIIPVCTLSSPSLFSPYMLTCVSCQTTRTHTCDQVAPVSLPQCT